MTGVVDDRYEIEREVGRGGMATVYLARDIRHGNRVALKILSPDLASMVSGERFNREIRITAGLQHPHILPVFDSGTFNGLPYYVMPYVDGPTVEQRIKAEGPLPIGEALEIACEVADALDHAHAQGIVHRDIKPSNILLAHGHAVVADFGIARAVEPVTGVDLTRTGIAVGTAAYMSPEQSAGEEVDGRADIYSLGCVLYEMLAGHPPFAATSPRALMAKHWMNEVPSLRATRKSVRKSIETLVLRSMAKRADQRFANAGDLEEAIQRVMTEERFVEAGLTPSEDQSAFDPLTPITNSDPALKAVLDVVDPDAEEADDSLMAATSSTIRVRPRAHAKAAGIALVAVAGAAFATWAFTRPVQPELDRNRVMVYPLLVPTDFTGSHNVGEDIGTMIGTALDGAGHLRWIDGWPLLRPEVRQNIRNLASADARALARSRRAAWYMTGRIVVRGDSSEVFLELNDVAGDSTVARGSAVGPTRDAWRTGLHAVNGVLPSLIPPGTADVDLLTGWRDRNPASVASFLLAESAFRRVHLAEALDHYRDALRNDSTFGLAAIRGAQAAAWNHRSGEAISFLELARRQRLSPRYTHFAKGYQSYLAGSADSAAAEFRRVIALDPEMSVAWMQLGETYMHLLPPSGNTDSLARIAFDEAYRLDSGARQLLFHSIELRLRRRDTAAAKPLLREFLSSRPDSSLAVQVRLMYDCVSKGPRGLDWLGIARAAPLGVIGVGNSLKAHGENIECVASAFDAVRTVDTAQAGAGRRWAAVIGLTTARLAQNRPTDAKAVIDSSIARGWGGGSLFLMSAPLYPELKDAAVEFARKDEALYGANYQECPYPVRLWQLGVWEALAGRVDVVEAISRNLAIKAEISRLPADARLSRSLRAFSTLARGDTASAMAMFRRFLDEPVTNAEIAWDLAAPHGMERLILARLHMAKKDYHKALDVANVFDAAWPSVFLLYVPASLQLRAEAAAAIPNSQLATQFRNRLAAFGSGGTVARK